MRQNQPRALIQGQVVDRQSGVGLAGLAVTNGEEIVETGPQGDYVVDVSSDEHAFVAVTTPDGYDPSSGFHWSTAGWAGAPRTVDFRLQRLASSVNTDRAFAQITDTHLGTTRGTSLTGALIAADIRQIIEEAEPGLILATGDLSAAGREAEHLAWRTAAEAVEVPVVPMFGNHDASVERAHSSRRTRPTRGFERIFGPTYRSFDWGGMHFALCVGDDQFFSSDDRQRRDRWLGADLARQPAQRPIVVADHFPPSQERWELLRRHNVSLVLYGHHHSSKVYERDGILVASTPSLSYGAIDGQPRGYRTVRHTGEGWHLDLRALVEPVPQPPSKRMAADPTLEELWQVPLPVSAHRGAPAVTRDFVLLGLSDENGQNRNGVLALDLASGSRRWWLETDSGIKQTVTLDEDGAVGAVLSVCGRLYVFETSTGRLSWEANLPGYPDAWDYRQPVIRDGAVLAGDGTRGYAAHELRSGARRWSIDVGYTIHIGSYASPVIVGDVCVLTIARRGLAGVDWASGALLWQRPIDIDYFQPAPFVLDATVVVAERSGGIVAFDAASGRRRWRIKDAGQEYVTGLAARENELFVTTSNGQIRAFEQTTGDLRWTVQTDTALEDMTIFRRSAPGILANPVIWEDVVVVAALDGYVYVLDRAGGTCVARHDLGSACAATPTLFDGTICVAAHNGRCARLRLPTGV